MSVSAAWAWPRYAWYSFRNWAFMQAIYASKRASADLSAGGIGCSTTRMQTNDGEPGGFGNEDNRAVELDIDKLLWKAKITYAQSYVTKDTVRKYNLWS